MYLFNKSLNKLTDHEDMGYDSKGIRLYKCRETGEVRSLSKVQKDIISAKREERRLDNLDFDKNRDSLIKNPSVFNGDNISRLKTMMEEE